MEMLIKDYLQKHDFELFKEYIRTSFDSKSHKKAWEYFQRIVRKDKFVERIKKIRECCEIPEGGFEEQYHTMDDTTYLEFPSKEWSLKNKDAGLEKVSRHIRALCKQFELNYRVWSHTLEDYIFYNKINKILPTNSRTGVANFVELAVTENKDFPLSLLISPYASGNMISNYLKTVLPIIKKVQLKYANTKTVAGKTRKRKVDLSERNDLIYQNSNDGKTLKEIRKILSGRGECLDDGHISKIISLEKRKRK